MVTSFNRNLNFEEYSYSLLSNLECNQIHICEPTFNYNDRGEISADDSHNLHIRSTTNKLLEITSKFKI